MPRSKSARRSRKLAIERLEDRRVLASINVIGGVLTVVGDDTADTISIASFDPYTTANVTITNQATGAQLSATPNMAAFNSVLVQGLGGDDEIYYSLFKDSTLEGGAGNDTIDGYEAADIIRGGPGDDTLRGYGGTDTLEGGPNHDTLFGGLGQDNLFGGDGDDTLEGGQSDDNLFGEAGNDRYRFAGPTLGTDRIDGETLSLGNDTLDFSGMPTPVFVSLGAFGSMGISSGLSLWLVSPATAQIENIIGSEFDDSLVGDDRPNRLEGRGGNDILASLDGNDILEGGFGSDLLRGGYGADTYVFAGNGNLGSDTIDEGTVNSAPGDPLSTQLAGLFPGDTLDFSDFDSGVAVGLGYGPVTVTITTGSPLEFFEDFFSDAGDFLGGLFNFATNGDAPFIELNMPENVIENAIGSRFDDLIYGSNLRNRLEGRGGNDRLRSLGGNDVLLGAAGDDLLDGSIGYDIYLYSEAGNLGHDTIADTGSGKLDFSQFGRARHGLS
jgi:Ca2+-binding RTX toxin-like protein